jgi:RPA family protein
MMQSSRSIKRQSAWHMLASEFGESTLNEKGSGEFDPSFVITKLGSKVNRVMVRYCIKVKLEIHLEFIIFQSVIMLLTQ